MKKYIVGFAILFFVTGIAQKKNIETTDIWATRKFMPEMIQGIKSMKDGLHYTTIEEQGLIAYDYKTGTPTEVIVHGNYDDYSFSSDENWVLLAQQTERIYRHSTMASYQVYNRKTKQFTKILDGKPIQEPLFSPTNDKVAFAFENNLYYQDLATQKVVQITQDGAKEKIINGITDWVYEEEFAFVRAFDWNISGTELGFIRFDESVVKEMNLPIYGAENYPAEIHYKYPKAGEKNASVSALIYNTNTQKTTGVKLKNEADFYIPKLEFNQTKPNELFVMVANRHQNQLEIFKVNTTDGQPTLFFTETDKAWIETDALQFKQTENGIIWKSERDGFSHLYLIDNQDSKKITQLTKGNYEVTNLYGAYQGKIYFQSTEEGSTKHTIYSLDTQTGQKTKLSKKIGANEANFSTTFNYFINTYSTANQPPIISLNNGADGSEIKQLTDNKTLSQTIDQYDLSPKEFTTFKLANYVTVNAWIIKPSKLEKNKKYPVLMYVYGGPGFQTVQDEWQGGNDFWFQQLAELGYIVVSVDGRGTGGKGTAFKKATYKQLGKLELEDQIEAAKYLQKLDYVDAKRIGIFGWSFGGYLSSLAMTKGDGIFKMGIAVAPVTNWRFYDTVYTERFLQTPQENPAGYDDNSPINFAHQLQGNFLLIHGTADDNVHYQNTLEMAEALVQANKQFDMQSYMDKNHGIYGGYTRVHLYTKMTNYILKNL